jgi:imidazoleglycerol-phosphate dehydratase
MDDPVRLPKRPDPQAEKVESNSDDLPNLIVCDEGNPLSRTATINRDTKETQISLSINLDGAGQSAIHSPVGFLNHMLDLFAKHSLIDLTIDAKGDTHIDDHHTTEDIGICLGLALAQAVGDKRGMARYGHFTLPMDETLVTTACDLGGRTAFVFNVPFPTSKIGTFDTELVAEFWNAVTNHARMNYHAILHHGQNSHHIAEGIFKASARAIRQAVAIDPRLGNDLASTKGII